MLPDSNPNKIPPALQGIILKFQLYGRPINIAKKVSDEDLHSANGAMEIETCIYGLDPLSVISETYQKFSMVLNTVRGASESYKKFEQFKRVQLQFNRSQLAVTGSDLITYEDVASIIRSLDKPKTDTVPR